MAQVRDEVKNQKSSGRTTLNKFAVPCEARNIRAQVQNEMKNQQNSERTTLNKFAVPCEARNILDVRNKVKNQQLNVPTEEIKYIKSKTICRICLRTDTKVRDIEETLIDFHDEITDYGVYENSALKYCAVCEDMLKKFYNFHQKCKIADKILKDNNLRQNKGYFPNNLHEKLLHGMQTSGKYSEKCENYTNKQANENTTQTIDDSEAVGLKYVPLDIETVKQHKNTSIEPDLVSELLPNIDDWQNNDDQINVSDNSNFVKISDDSEKLNKTKKQNVKKTLVELANINLENEETSESRDTNVMIKHKRNSRPQCIRLGKKILDLKDYDVYNDPDNKFIKVIVPKKQVGKHAEQGSLKRESLRKPLANHKEMEKVFDIELFVTDKEAKAEMKLRKTSNWYLSAKHKCEICYNVFKTDKHLKFHMRWHDPSAGDHVCEVCQMRFPNINALNKHCSAAHFGKFKCKMCPLITYQRVAMAAHYNMHMGVKYKCHICHRIFMHSSSYLNHLREMHDGICHVCMTCAKTFASKLGLRMHRTRIHKTSTITDSISSESCACAPCGITFVNERVYTIHVKNTEAHRELAKTIIACNKCGIRFENEESLSSHKREHQPVAVKRSTELICSVCAIRLPSRPKELIHMRKHHPNSEYNQDLERRRTHMCDTCGKCFVSTILLRNHKTIHNDKPYLCELCPARFHSSVKLKRHRAWHEPPKRECKVCGKKFVSVSGIYRHMRSHIKDRCYKCPLCDKGFLRACAMREHLRGVHYQQRRERKQGPTTQQRASQSEPRTQPHTRSVASSLTNKLTGSPSE